MTTRKDYDLHMTFTNNDGEDCGGVHGRVLTSDIIRGGERNLGYNAFRKAEKMVTKWLSDPRWFDCEMSNIKVRLELRGNRYDMVFNATEWRRILQIRNVRIPIAWKLYEPLPVVESEIPDDDIPF